MDKGLKKSQALNISVKAVTSSKTSAALIISALGIVFGDIGTSPLYAINELFFGASAVPRTSEHIVGSMSLVFWVLTLVICVKYLGFVLLADNEGEGGVFALYSKIHKYKKGPISVLKILLMLAAGLLFGEGVITPAISVLSAVEGLGLVTPTFQSWTVPMTIAVLILIFSIQKRGTHNVGRFFGPIALIWFFSIAALGVLHITDSPEILKAFNPYFAIQFLKNTESRNILITLGAVMLVITGGEALFADMGHFGRSPIRKGWFSVVYPALVLNYWGQGAYLLSGNTVKNSNVFYSMVPSSFLMPMVLLATLATVIASQALISGAFSLGQQAIALGLFPRLRTIHTHEEHSGQIYLPLVNWMLFLGSSSLVLIFQTSTHLVSAYGLSLSGVMTCTSLAMIAISIEYWNWEKRKAWTIFGVFAVVDFAFLTSNSLKIFEGGFIPLTLGFIIFSVMRIWRWGRKATYAAYSEFQTPTLQEVVDMKSQALTQIPRNVVLMVPRPLRSLQDRAPVHLRFFLNRYEFMPRHLFLWRWFIVKFLIY